LAYLLYGHALRTLPVPAVSTLVLAEPAVATVLGVTMLGDVMDTLGEVGLGVLCVVLVAAAVSTDSRRARNT
jgi:DME family drug/metabolite transporter